MDGGGTGRANLESARTQCGFQPARVNDLPGWNNSSSPVTQYLKSKSAHFTRKRRATRVLSPAPYLSVLKPLHPRIPSKSRSPPIAYDASIGAATASV